jgi:hypothetical protein
MSGALPSEQGTECEFPSYINNINVVTASNWYMISLCLQHLKISRNYEGCIWVPTNSAETFQHSCFIFHILNGWISQQISSADQFR